MKKLPPSQKYCDVCGKYFEVQPYRSDTARYCSGLCRQKGNAQSSAIKRGNMQRYRGEHRTYVKLNGQHMHRVVAEKILGRKLAKGEVIHHLDGNKQNNDISNIKIMTQSQHVQEHIKFMMEKRWGKHGS